MSTFDMTNDLMMPARDKINAALGYEVRIDSHMNQVRDEVQFWISCMRCGAVLSSKSRWDGEAIRHAGAPSVLADEMIGQFNGNRCCANRAAIGPKHAGSMIHKPAAQRYVVLQAKNCLPEARVAAFGWNGKENAHASVLHANAGSSTSSWLWDRASSLSDDDWCIVDLHSDCYVNKPKDEPSAYLKASEKRTLEEATRAQLGVDFGTKPPTVVVTVDMFNGETPGQRKARAQAITVKMIPIEGEWWHQTVSPSAHSILVGRENGGMALFNYAGEENSVRIYREIKMREPTEVEAINEIEPLRAVIDRAWDNRTIDGLPMSEILRKYKNLCGIEKGRTSPDCIEPLRKLNALTRGQLIAAREEWSRRLRELVNASEQADKEREARRCGWDPGSEDEL